MALPEVGDQVTVVVPGTVTRVNEESGGLFDVDYGPGWLVATEGMLLEENRVILGLVEYARRGVVWNRKGPGGYGWVCPMTGCGTAISSEDAEAGRVCSACRGRIAVDDVTRDLIETALDFLCDHLCDDGMDVGEVWRIRREAAGQVIDDTIRYSRVSGLGRRARARRAR